MRVSSLPRYVGTVRWIVGVIRFHDRDTHGARPCLRWLRPSLPYPVAGTKSELGFLWPSDHDRRHRSTNQAGASHGIHDTRKARQKPGCSLERMISRPPVKAWARLALGGNRRSGQSDSCRQERGPRVQRLPVLCPPLCSPYTSLIRSFFVPRRRSVRAARQAHRGN